MTLFEELKWRELIHAVTDEKVIDNEKIQTALDLIRDKYGVDIIKPASFIEHDKENV